jgi:sugar O-acyltransferase (sialic acid O-acetyltransferase NeuD family)
MSNGFCTPRPGPNGLAIFGAGAAGREIAWLAKQCWGDDVKLTFIVDQRGLADTVVNGIPVMHLSKFAEGFPGTPVCVAVGDPSLREDCVAKCAGAGLGFATLVHPRVEASPWVTIGTGTIICAGTILTTNVAIGQHVHINVACSISHDAEIRDFATLSPGIHISGWVTIGRGAFVGTGAVVKNGTSNHRIVIGEKAIIGAGACVISDVEARTTVVGVPANRRL